LQSTPYGATIVAMKAGVSHTITVAAAQLSARPMNDAATALEGIALSIKRAAEKRVDLLVLPECAYPAYLIGSAASYRAGDHLRSEEFVSWLGRQAAAHRLHVICGFIEDAKDTLFNSAAFLDDRGKEIGRVRKRFLWNADHDWFGTGTEIRAFDSDLGRIGIIICAEARDPELLATLAADGAQLVAMPTCWINASRDPGKFENPQVEFLIEARARELGMPFVCADKWGLEQGSTGYVGQSRILRADGSVAAEAPIAGDGVIAARVVLDRPRRAWISPRRRRELDADARGGIEPPISPIPAADQRIITVAVVPTSVVTSRFTGGMGHSLFEPIQRSGVSLAMLNVPHEATAEQLEMLAAAFDLRAAAFPSRADVHELAGARVGRIAGQWARSFATARAMTLAGAEILMFFDAPDDLAILRARALENRVFVMAANDRSAAIIDPTGRILARSTPTESSEAVAQVNLNDALDKSVAPKTDIFVERRPELYRY
jgi:predicted amidohydrolase